MTGKVDTKEVWTRFIQEGSLEPANLTPEIEESWHLCRQKGLNPHDGITDCILTPEEFEERLAENELLITLAKQNVKRLQKFLRGWRFVIILTDKDGYILYKEGENSISIAAETIRFKEGAKWGEIEVGTNAIGLAARYKKPMMVRGYEHFSKASQQWNCSAAPIFNQHKEMIGVLNVSSLYQSINQPYVLACVKLIADSISLDWKKKMHEDMEFLLRTTFQSSGQYIVCTIDKYICALPKNLQQKYQNWIGTSLSRFAQETGAVSAVHIPIMHHHRLIGYRIPLRAETSFVWNGSRGLSKSYKQVLESIKNVAPTDTTVHLVGETGVGKKFLASCIHENSPKSTAPFYKLHCSMLTKDILQRFLSTDLQRLTKKRHQVVEEATIFLEEIGELSISSQQMLLTILQEKERQHHKSYRFITSSTKDIRDLVEQGIIDQDLFYYIYAYPIYLTPLRERNEDIIALIDYYCDKNNWHPEWRINWKLLFSKGQWYGNVRELYNTLDRCRILYKEDAPTEEQLYEQVMIAEKHMQKSYHRKDPKTKFEIQAITNALKKHHGNVSEATKELNMSRATLYRKIKKYQIKNFL